MTQNPVPSRHSKSIYRWLAACANQFSSEKGEIIWTLISDQAGSGLPATDCSHGTWVVHPEVVYQCLEVEKYF
jgi:hypothetical protein